MQHALSLKQPWATLLVHGLKQVEVRRWATGFRGRLLIHAARLPDERPEGWRHLPEQLRGAARQVGGIIGSARLHGCTRYDAAEAFVADQALHLNDPAWFVAGPLYGLYFRETRPLPFRPLPGFVRIFQLDLAEEALPSPDCPALERWQRLRQALGRPTPRSS